MLSPLAYFLSNYIGSFILASIFLFRVKPEVCDNRGVKGEDGKAQERGN